MAYKRFLLADKTAVTIYKRKTNRSLRLSVAADGSVKVSIPIWAPYASGLRFVTDRQAWIQSQRKAPLILQTGQAIGKAHHLEFIANSTAQKPVSRISGSQIRITYPDTSSTAASNVQQVARTAAIRALRLQAEQLLPKRLDDLAAQYNFSFQSVSVKQLSGRWGSCDQAANIVLNLFLMQLPWDCIDYVLLHELTHTKLMKHGPQFWQAMETVLPNTKIIRRTMQGYQPVLNSPLS